MSIFTDVVSTFSKSLLTRILVVVVFLLCFAYVANGVGSWFSAKFSNEPTREELVDHAAKQGVVIETQDTALKQKDETIEMVKDLSTAAIVSVTIKNLDMAQSIYTKPKWCLVIPTSIFCRTAWVLKE